MASPLKLEQRQLVSKPPLDPNSFATLQSSRFDKVHLYDEADQAHYRYELTVIDRPLTPDQIANTTLPCGVFLIPAGREAEYLFSSRRGLRSIAESAGCARLVAAAFHRSHVYESQRIVQAELEYVVQVIARRGSFLYRNRDARERAFAEAPNFHIPFMAVDGIGKRNVVAEGDTETTGQFVVEEVYSNEGGTRSVLRRLYFMKNPNVIQTEVAMKDESGEVDLMRLAFDYHKELVAGFVALALLPRDGENHTAKEALVIGLGGGGLLNFLHGFMPSMNITAVELDEHVLAIAKSHFGFKEDEKMRVRIGDGLKVMAEKAVEETSSQNEDTDDSTKESDAIRFSPSSMTLMVIDVDSKDTSVGMSCPPVPFISVEYLTEISSLLQNDGVLAVNVSARDPAMLDTVKKNVQSIFESVFISSTDEEAEEDLNVVIFARKTKCSLPSKLQLGDALCKQLDEKMIQADDNIQSWLKECIAGIEALTGDYPQQKCKSKASGRKGKKNTKKKKGKKR